MALFSLVHNIPSPYRLHLFRLLHEHLQLREIDFHVHFMASGHADRPHWQSKIEELSFPHTFWRDIGPTVHHKSWHLNPGMISALAQVHSEYLLIGGPWDSLTGMLVSLLARRGVGITWQEGNTSSPGRITGWNGALKRSLIRRFKYIAVPGIEGQRHLTLLFAGEVFGQQCVFLPNIVDESQFSPGWRPENHQVREKMRRELKVDEQTRLAIWPARLISEKGILEFLSLLQPDLLRGWRILLIGQGELETSIRETLKRYELAEIVELYPYVSYERMPSIYQAADLFLLPSLKDPNPLSVVEALHSGLPLLVSKRIGNFPEALEEGINGWGIDPYDNSSVLAAITLAFADANREQLLLMGRRSLVKAQTFWQSHQAVNRFLDAVL